MSYVIASVLHVIWYVLNAVALEQRMYYTAFSRCVGGQGGLRYVCTAGTALCVYSTDTDTCARVLHSQTSSIRTRLLYAHISCMQQQAVEVFVDEEEDRADAPHNLCAWRPLAQVLLLNRS